MDSSEIEQSLAPLFTVKQVLINPLSSLSVMFVAYGIYIMVFGLSLNVLRQRNIPSSKLYAWCTVSLFTLATVDVVFQTWGYTRQPIILFNAMKTKDYTPLLNYLLYGDPSKIAWFAVSNLGGTLMNTLADTMLIHRCYIIWNSNKPMLFVLAFITFSINGIVTSIYSLNLYSDKCFSLEGISIGSIIAAIIAEHDTSKESNIRIMLISGKINDATLIATTVFNTVLTVLTGARIWWITLQARKVMGKAVDTQYKAIVAIVLESGLLYSLTLMIAIIVGDTLDPDGRGTVPVDLTMISTQMSGIAPTLIIVRAAYNKTAESVDQVVSTWQCAARTRQFESQMGSVLPSNVDSESGDEVDTSSEKV